MTEHRAALAVCVLMALGAGAFAGSYSLALGRPQPRMIATDIVGASAGRRSLVRQLEHATQSSLDLRPVASRTQATADLAAQRAYCALILSGRPTLLVASAAGASVARLLEQAARRPSAVSSGGLVVQDVRPLPPRDPNGLVIFYAALAATLIGSLGTFQLSMHGGLRTLRSWLAFLTLAVVLTGLSVAVVTGPVLGALGGSVLEEWVILTLEAGIAALVGSGFSVVLGRWAILPTWLLFVVLGTTSSGGAVASPLLPAFYQALGRFLPPGSTVGALRNAVYFSDAQHVEPFLVLVAWGAAGLAFLVVSVRRTHRLPGGLPYRRYRRSS